MHGNHQPSHSYLQKVFPLVSHQQQNSRFMTKLFMHFQYKKRFFKKKITLRQQNVRLKKMHTALAGAASAGADTVLNLTP